MVVSIASRITLKRAKHCALEPRGPRTWISMQLCSSSSKVIILSHGPTQSFDPRHHWYRSELDGSHVWVIFLSCAYACNLRYFNFSSLRRVYLLLRTSITCKCVNIAVKWYKGASSGQRRKPVWGNALEHDFHGSHRPGKRSTKFRHGISYSTSSSSTSHWNGK